MHIDMSINLAIYFAGVSTSMDEIPTSCARAIIVKMKLNECVAFGKYKEYRCISRTRQTCVAVRLLCESLRPIDSLIVHHPHNTDSKHWAHRFSYARNIAVTLVVANFASIPKLCINGDTSQAKNSFLSINRRKSQHTHTDTSIAKRKRTSSI